MGELTTRKEQLEQAAEDLIHDVQELLRQGRPADLIQRDMEEKYPEYSPHTISKHRQTAFRRYAVGDKTWERKKPAYFGLQIARLEYLFNECVVKKDLKVALAVLKEINDLAGLKKMTATTQTLNVFGNGAAQIANQYSVEDLKRIQGESLPTTLSLEEADGIIDAEWEEPE